MLGRRDILRYLTGMAAYIATSAHDRRARAMTTKRPNFVIIMADDLGYGNLSCYGQQKFGTPAIDTMALEGIRFTDHYAGSSICAPSRASFLTGFHVGHSRIKSNAGEEPLRYEDVTLAEHLRANGYATGVIGKWGLGGIGTTGHPNKQGFDYFFGYLGHREAHRHYPASLWRNDQLIELAGNNPESATGTNYAHYLFTQEAESFVLRNRNRPFLLFLAYTLPHAELIVPESELAPWRGSFDEIPYAGDERAGYAPQRTPRAAFAAMVTLLDRDVGRILALIRELGIEKDTLIAFTSDNGPAVEGGSDPDFFVSSGGLRGAKGSLYEGGIRVPLIVRWSGHVPAAQESNLPSANWDILPTLIETAGGVSPPGIDGISLLPTLLGKPDAQVKHDYLYWELNFNEALRMGRWKALRGVEAKRIALYDINHDPREERDVADQNPEVVAQAEEYLASAKK